MPASSYIPEPSQTVPAETREPRIHEVCLRTVQKTTRDERYIVGAEHFESAYGVALKNAPSALVQDYLLAESDHNAVKSREKTEVTDLEVYASSYPLHSELRIN